MEQAYKGYTFLDAEVRYSAQLALVLHIRPDDTRVNGRSQNKWQVRVRKEAGVRKDAAKGKCKVPVFLLHELQG